MFQGVVESGATLSELGSGARWEEVWHLITLNAVADLACVGLGIARGPHVQDHPTYVLRAHTFLRNEGTLSRLPKDRVIVLPKMRVPQTGITIRSLSHHVAALVGTSVRVEWSTSNFVNFPASVRQ
ncbi:MAG: hypothetical protein M5U28_21110 [Sandaracinaceae bacterium]|nr:hypothetical protein [Sandaracinaceae bacterium]